VLRLAEAEVMAAQLPAVAEAEVMAAQLPAVTEAEVMTARLPAVAQPLAAPAVREVPRVQAASAAQR
jgi:hypothetical protein